ncbi:MAG: hypothetical protein GF329_20400 [Candidatus Lokiarchaeota archaeon]|nr:hypothetical protein [Candidatus Lokiarchaeota archaeon]
MSFKISGMELTPCFVPFKENIRNLLKNTEKGVGMAIDIDEEWLGGDFVICKLFCGDHVGLGEAFVWLPETGTSPEQIIDIIENTLSKYVIGESPFNTEKIMHKMNNNVARNEVAKGLLDMACYDLMGKITGRSASDFIGGKLVEKIPLAALIPLADLETMVMVAKSFIKMGYKSLRYKLGNGIREDIEISKAIREKVGEDIHLRVDYNQAYTPNKAVSAINAIEKYNIDFAEQPVNKEDFVGMSYVQKRVNVPLMAHESFFSVNDFIILVELNAVGVLGVNSERPGGVSNALAVINYAHSRGLKTVIHNQTLGIANAMQIHLTAAKFNYVGYATELFGHVMMEDDLIKSPIVFEKGSAEVPTGPGWGVELDEKALEKYRTREKTIIRKKN